MTEDSFEEICELIIEKVSENKNPCENIFEYVDRNLDAWDIDILDHFLDDIISHVEKTIKLRQKLSSRKNDDNVIIFKESEEEQEKKQLKRVLKNFDKLYDKAMSIGVYEGGEEDLSGTSYGESHGSSWKNTLDRLDLIYSRVD